MEAVLDFVRGPLFRLTFALMILGLLRMLYMSFAGIIHTYITAGDKEIPWKDIILRTLSWLFPAGRIFRMKPIWGTISFIFHIGLIIVPLFYLSHIQLWRNSLGFGWWALPLTLADILTITTIVTAILLFLARTSSRDARALSRKQDYIWPLILAIPFITGFICVNLKLTAGNYQWVMLIHILSSELIFVLIPFTKIAHCILFPLNILISTFGWKFPADAGEKVAVTLNKEELPV